MKKILYIFGTRPEAIKLAPLINKMKEKAETFLPLVCSSSQHKELLASMLDLFGIKPEFDLDIMKNNQTLFEITANILTKIEAVLEESNPDLIVVQGDTATTFMGALSGYYKKIPVAHVEAGLRSGNAYAPFPEENYRKMTSQIASFHFAPTKTAVKNLNNENITTNVWLTGNTVVDALQYALREIKNKNLEQKYSRKHPYINKNKLILVTGHRRESFGQPLANICSALASLAESNKGLEIVYPVHLNPSVKDKVYRELGGINNIHLTEPLDYFELIWLMSKSYFVITDSGGIQEEAPGLGKPVLVTREVTERNEGISSGNAILVGYNKEKIVSQSLELLQNLKKYSAMSKAKNPYGNGQAADEIIKIISDSRIWQNE